MNRSFSAAILGGLIGATVLTGLYWLDRRESANRQRDLQRDTRIVARQFTSRLQSGLERHLIGLQQMANFWANSDEVSEDEFSDFAASTLRLNPLCLRISFLDPSFRVAWVFPAASNEALVGFDARTHPEGYETLRRAKQTRESVLSPPLQLVNDQQGFVLAAPIYKKGSYLGTVVCSFRSFDFFRSLALSDVGDLYEQAVADAGIPILGGHSAAAPAAIASVETLQLGGRTWQIRVAPKPDVLQARLYSGRPATWILGTLVAFLLGIASYLLAHRLLASQQRLHVQDRALRETRQQLDQAMEQLVQAEKLSALGELVAGVAHEINSPLTGIQGNAELLLQKEDNAHERKRLGVIVSEASRAGKIVRNLLAFARKQPPEKKLLNLNEVIEKTLELKGHHLKVNNISVERDLAQGLPRTMLDFQQVQQVLINLLNNAEQAMKTHDRPGILRISTRASGPNILLQVADNGPGIPKDIQRRIFEPFFTTKPVGRGTGLGLSVCYGIIQEHEGRLTVESQPGQGACFAIELPIVGETQVPKMVTAAQPEVVGPGGMQILIVDDEPSIRDLFTEFLTRQGHEVTAVEDVPEALEALRSQSVNLIISDMKMPTGSGKDLYAAVLRSKPQLAKRIVFTTGDGASPETRAFLEDTGNHVVLKPCSLQELYSAVLRAGQFRN